MCASFETCSHKMGQLEHEKIWLTEHVKNQWMKWKWVWTMWIWSWLGNEILPLNSNSVGTDLICLHMCCIVKAVNNLDIALDVGNTVALS